MGNRVQIKRGRLTAVLRHYDAWQAASCSSWDLETETLDEYLAFLAEVKATLEKLNGTDQ